VPRRSTTSSPCAPAALVIGEDRARLLGTYAGLHLARAARDREEDLARRRVNSESELLAARAAYDAAAAEHGAARESVAFSHRARVLDAERALLLARASLRNRQRRLHLLGVPPAEVEGLEAEPEDRIARCALRAPIGGVVIRKHMVLGENVETASEVFVLADLSSVLVRFAVPPGDLGLVKEGQRVRARVDGAAGEREGTLDLLGHTAEADAALAVPVAAVVRVENRDVVFVREGEGTFDVRPVRLGRRDARRVEVLGGVAAADDVVVENAFVLKAELRKGTGGHEH
jgi:cobalt-zinc-cadmium efflux system membrane fusion protein